MMPWTLLSLAWTLIFCAFVDCITLPPIHWNASNPMFKASNNDHVIEVNLNDDINFVCPHYTEDDLQNPSSRGYYIIYQVTKEEYDDCNLYTSTSANMIVNCSTPQYLKFFTIIFELYSPVPNGQEFKRGESYYYITTSTGYEEGLMNRHHGACWSNHMKLTIKVCCETTTGDTAPIPPVQPWEPPPPESMSTPTTGWTAGEGDSVVWTTESTTLSTRVTRPATSTTTTTAATTTTHRGVHTRRTTTEDMWSPPKSTAKPDVEDSNENEVYPIKEGLVNSASYTLRLCIPPSLVLSCLLLHILCVFTTR